MLDLCKQVTVYQVQHHYHFIPKIQPNHLIRHETHQHSQPNAIDIYDYRLSSCKKITLSKSKINLSLKNSHTRCNSPCASPLKKKIEVTSSFRVDPNQASRSLRDTTYSKQFIKMENSSIIVCQRQAEKRQELPLPRNKQQILLKCSLKEPKLLKKESGSTASRQFVENKSFHDGSSSDSSIRWHLENQSCKSSMYLNNSKIVNQAEPAEKSIMSLSSSIKSHHMNQFVESSKSQHQEQLQDISKSMCNSIIIPNHSFPEASYQVKVTMPGHCSSQLSPAKNRCQNVSFESFLTVNSSYESPVQKLKRKLENSKNLNLFEKETAKSFIREESNLVERQDESMIVEHEVKNKFTMVASKLATIHHSLYLAVEKQMHLLVSIKEIPLNNITAISNEIALYQEIEKQSHGFLKLYQKYMNGLNQMLIKEPFQCTLKEYFRNLLAQNIEYMMIGFEFIVHDVMQIAIKEVQNMHSFGFRLARPFNMDDVVWSLGQWKIHSPDMFARGNFDAAALSESFETEIRNFLIKESTK